MIFAITRSYAYDFAFFFNVYRIITTFVCIYSKRLSLLINLRVKLVSGAMTMDYKWRI